MEHDDPTDETGTLSGQQGSTPSTGDQVEGPHPSTSAEPTENVNSKRNRGDGSRDPKDGGIDDVAAEGTGVKRVRVTRGYTTYPAFMFDVPPPQLTIEHLRRKYLIAEIERSNAEKIYYNRAVNFMSFATDSIRSFAAANGFQMPGSAEKDVSDHRYSMSSNANPDIDSNDKSSVD